jgi:hypothetical protein
MDDRRPKLATPQEAATEGLRAGALLPAPAGAATRETTGRRVLAAPPSAYPARMPPANDVQGASSPLDPFGLWDAWARSLEFHAPLSGAVAQAIQASLAEHLGQLGLVNVNVGAAGDPDLERRIVDHVASYGRQLGWLLDAVDALVRVQAGDAPGDDDRAAFARVADLRREVDAVKAQAAAERVERLIDDVRALAADPEGNGDALRRLRAALAET